MVGWCEVAAIYVGSGDKVYVLAEPLLLAAFGIVSNLKFLDLYRRCESFAYGRDMHIWKLNTLREIAESKRLGYHLQMRL